MKKYLYLIFLLCLPSYIFSQTDLKTESKALLQAGTISVTLGGNFIITGTFPAFVGERVDQFVTRMYNQAKETVLGRITDSKVLAEINEKIKDYPLRNIELKRATGEVEKLDLLRFRLTGNFKDDPYLKNDDVLIFPYVDLTRNFFTVSGAVNNPGKFQYVDGDKLSDALFFAQGLNKAYENVRKAEIDRLSYTGNSMTTDTVDINSNIPLERGDRIVVLANETNKKDYNVLVVGEVNSPGYIPITKDHTTIKDVIERAGGFKKDASMRRARILSGNSISLLLEKEYGIKLKENTNVLTPEISNTLVKLENLLMYRMSDLTQEDTAYFFLENQLRVLDNGSSIDFSKISDDSSMASKYEVKDGDIIIIPVKDNAVYVYGQVVDPGKVPFVEGEDYKYYINKAGGTGEYADDDIMVIKAASREWISPIKNKVKIEPGDYVWVPRVPARSLNYYIYSVGGYLSIVASAATIFLLILQFKK